MEVAVNVDTDFSPPDEDYSNEDGVSLSGEEYYEYEYPTLAEESLKAVKQFAIGHAAISTMIFCCIY